MFVGILTVIFGFAIYKLLTFVWNYGQLRSTINRMTGPKDIFFIGNTHLFERDPVKFNTQLMDYCKTYENDKMFRIWLGPIPLVVFHEIESVEKMLASTVHINKSNLYDFLHPWIGEGLLTSSGKKWKSRRQLLTPAFHFKILNDFFPIFNEQARILTSIFDQCFLSTSNSMKVDIFPKFTLTALDIISETAMGKSINAQTSVHSSYVDAILELSEQFMERSKNPFYHSGLIYWVSPAGRRNARNLKTVHQFTDSVIQERKKYSQLATADNSTKKRKLLAFLDLLIEYQRQGQPITDGDIRDEVDTFMFEGHDTTAAAMTWSLFLVARYPEVQKKVHAELDAIFKDDPDRDVTPEDLPKLVYLDKVIKEGLRLYPSVPYIGRKIEQDNVEMCGYHLPRGTNIVILTAALQRRTDNFGPDADKFRPERFEKEAEINSSSGSANITEAEKLLDVSSKARSPFAYVPFSAGPRNCIGAKFAQMEEKVVLAHVLRRYSVTCDLTEEELGPASQLILRPSNPVMVSFTKRSQL